MADVARVAPAPWNCMSTRQGRVCHLTRNAPQVAQTEPGGRSRTSDADHNTRDLTWHMIGASHKEDRPPRGGRNSGNRTQRQPRKVLTLWLRHPPPRS
jgi:hypothetical protein